MDLSTAQILIDGRPWRVRLDEPVDCGLPLHFSGPQPRVFGADIARATPMVSGDFIGSVAHGASVNVMELRLNPHCNGTHTETAGHLTAHAIPIARVLDGRPVPASVVTVESVFACEVPDEIGPGSEPNDQVVPAFAVDRAMSQTPEAFRRGLVIRSSASADPFRDYEQHPAPYLTAPAAERLAAWGVEHLVVEWPSIDRLHDGGLVAAHRSFWEIREQRIGRPQATVTELACLPESLRDGLYVLLLQAPAFDLDVAPSRPVLYRVETTPGGPP